MQIDDLLPKELVRDFCRRNHIVRLAVFGSALRKDFSPDSDLDILVEFEPAKTPGFQFFEIQEQLSEITGLTVDLNTSNSLSPDFRDVVVREAYIIYEAA